MAINEGEIMIDVGSAFLGAIFAFLFLLLQRLLSKIYQRKSKNLNAIVRLEQQLNEFLSINNDNIFILGDFIKAVENKYLYNINFKKIEIDRKIILDLNDINFRNEVFDLHISVYKVVESLKSIEEYYNEFKQAHLNGIINKETFEFNTGEKFLIDLKFLKKSTENLDEKLEAIMSKTQVLFDYNETLLFKIIRKFSTRKYNSEKFVQDYKNRLQKIKKDRKESVKKSKKEIDAISGELSGK
ncbi:MAG: hypothetical protein ACOCUF_00920 [Patescibacteria group bacterium]